MPLRRGYWPRFQYDVIAGIFRSSNGATLNGVQINNDALATPSKLNGSFSIAGSVVNHTILDLNLGDADDAFVRLEQGYKEHSNTLMFLKMDPAFDPLREILALQICYAASSFRNGSSN